MTVLRTERNVRTLKSFTGIIEKLCEGHEELWFRGCGRSSYPLRPSLYRHPTLKRIDALLPKTLSGFVTQQFMNYLSAF